MTSIIQIKNSETAGVAPGSGDLAVGELAINLTDKKIYSKNSSNTIVELGGGGAPDLLTMLTVIDLGLITEVPSETAYGNIGSVVTSITTGTGLTGGTITDTGTISLADTTVTPGSYTSADITVDAQGRITAASNGTGGGGGITTGKAIAMAMIFGG